MPQKKGWFRQVTKPAREESGSLCLSYARDGPSMMIHSIAPTFNESPRVWWWTNADTFASAHFPARRIRAWILAIYRCRTAMPTPSRYTSGEGEEREKGQRTKSRE